MGASSSKQTNGDAQQPKVFLPNTPTEFSQGLLAQLDSSVESDYTRSQYTDKYIADRVHEELAKAEQEASEALKKAMEQLPAPRDITSSEDSNTLSEKLEQLKNKLESRPSAPQLGKEITKSRQQLVQCFKDNQGKPLNCWDQVEAFKQQVQKQQLQK